MKIYILSDTHNAVSFSCLERLLDGADMIIHLGDGYRDASDLEALARCPVYHVRGNCDMLGKSYALIEVAGHRIFAVHGDAYGVKSDTRRLLAAADELLADIVLYGHTHKPDISFIANKLVINPGSLAFPRGKMPTYCVLTVEEDRLYPELIEYKGEK